MKWSEEKVRQLHDLAFAGKSNKEIAEVLDVSINDVYAKRSQLGITIPKVKAAQAGIVNPKAEVTNSRPLPERFQKMRELDRKRNMLDLLEPTLKKADSSIVELKLTNQGKAVEIHYSNGAQRRACIECDSLMAMIADVTHKCLY